MIEIIAGVWLICLFLSLLTSAYSVYLTRKKLRSKKFQNINIHLQKIGMFWSNSAADFAILDTDSIINDENKSLRSAYMLGLLGLASIPGFLLLFVVTISIHFIAISRKEQALFQSALAQSSTLEINEVQSLVDKLNQIQ